ncbi:MAG: chromosomal replication initiator protein DnaA [Clostridia bacterium]|nr:chromosomal replication initiator protein DnaA [Clostridia bacterium]
MIEIHKIWKETLSFLSSEITAVAYMLWIDNLTPLCVKDNTLILLAPSLHAKITINKNYKEMIRKALDKTKSSLIDADIIIDEETSYYTQEIEAARKGTPPSPSPAKVKQPQFITRYIFDNFVVGESNKLAFHAAQSVAQNPGSAEGYLSFNPLFIYGDVGLGKTHLLHAIGNYITEHLPDLRVLYVPTEKLTNDYVEAISNNNSGDKGALTFRSFREKYRNVDVLMIDDVQFLQKKTGLQDVVFHIFNELYQNGKQIILTSDRPPKEIGTLEDRLRSRFEGGLLADVGAPNLEMRIAIIRKKMFLEKLAVNDDVVYFLAEQFDSNIRELEGALSKVILYANLINKPYPDINTAKEALKNNQQKKVGIDSSDIIHAVCSYFHVSKSEIISKKKTKDIVVARMTAIFLITEMLSLPLVTIGQLFGGRDHTTIIHSRDKILAAQKENKEVVRQIKDIKAMLNG